MSKKDVRWIKWIKEFVEKTVVRYRLKAKPEKELPSFSHFLAINFF